MVTESRNQETPLQRIGDRAGLLQGDGQPCYGKLSEAVIQHGCKSYDEAKSLAHRQAKSVPVLAALRAWVDDAKLRQIDNPQSHLMDGAKYCDRQWVPLTRFAADGRVREISNNACESALRNVVLGRKNWLSFGNEDGAVNSLILLSLIQSCREIGVHPLACLRDSGSTVERRRGRVIAQRAYVGQGTGGAAGGRWDAGRGGERGTAGVQGGGARVVQLPEQLRCKSRWRRVLGGTGGPGGPWQGTDGLPEPVLHCVTATAE